MTLDQQLQLSLALLLSALLSLLIGYDRERRNKSAGLRTHMLAGVGSCLFTILSMNAFPEGDPTRVASNIVTGIGFLGAGTIIHTPRRAKALTTAASIWATAAIGMAVGTGAWLIAIVGTLIIWSILALLPQVDIGASQNEKSEDGHSNDYDNP